MTEGEFKLTDVVHVLIRHRRVTLGAPMIVTLLTGIALVFIRPTFTATTTFVPETNSQMPRLPSGLAGLAGQFGISLGSDASKSPKFYAEIVRSRALMEDVLRGQYLDPRLSDGSPSDSASLLQILGTKGRDAADSLFRGVRKLNGLLSVRVNTPTGIVGLSVDSRYPELAAAVANRFVLNLNAFNTEHRQSQAREQRRFVEQRLADGERDLRSTEEDLRVFYERNRAWQQSPQLTFDEGRLRRQVEIRQELYLTLKREFETARIQEVNDTPVITVIDVAVPPTKKSKPKRSLVLAVGLVLGTMIGVTWAAGIEFVAGLRRGLRTDSP